MSYTLVVYVYTRYWKMLLPFLLFVVLILKISHSEEIYLLFSGCPRNSLLWGWAPLSVSISMFKDLISEMSSCLSGHPGSVPYLRPK